MDLFPKDAVLTVTQLNSLAREALEANFPLLWVSGEISNLARPGSGHVYFTLKDAGAQIRCAMFKNRAQLLPFRLEEGMHVEARALVSIYEARGDYQLNVEALRQAGLGKLFEAFARLRDQLEREGLFAPERKKPIPDYPRRIGLMTSLQAAALQDMLAVLARRAPHVPVLIYPVPVQGVAAAQTIAKTLARASERNECDLLILARGGGSLEDLWAFNEEVLARALAACKLPVITGVGHETDTTIVDYVGDYRAATPTAAAERVSAAFAQAPDQLTDLAARMKTATLRGLQARMQRVDIAAHRLLSPTERLNQMRLRVDHLQTRHAHAHGRLMQARLTQLARMETRLRVQRPDFTSAHATLTRNEAVLHKLMSRQLASTADRLNSLEARLTQSHPDTVLARGYSITRRADGSIVRNAATLTPSERLSLRFAEGGAEVVVEAPTSGSSTAGKTGK